MNDKIDFVVTWVDGNDEEWQNEKNKYNPGKNTDARKSRYRDWDNLKYWFRSIEKYTPWVNKIHFITYGHLPKWLNVTNPKLNIVKHSDYMPEEYLPTFNSIPIELNMHRIKGLEEKFVYFNDDMFIMKEMEPKDFFKKGLPCDSALLNAEAPRRKGIRTYVEIMNAEIINDYFNKHSVIKKNFFKWVNLKYGLRINIKNLMLMPGKRFTGIQSMHVAHSYLKSTFETVWEKEFEALDNNSRHRFRSDYTINHWLMSNWQIASGKFIPRSTKIGRSILINDDDNNNNNVMNVIRSRKYKMLCINDFIEDDKRFDEMKEKLNSYFDEMLPEKSSFEI